MRKNASECAVSVLSGLLLLKSIEMGYRHRESDPSTKDEKVSWQLLKMIGTSPNPH